MNTLAKYAVLAGFVAVLFVLTLRVSRRREDPGLARSVSAHTAPELTTRNLPKAVVTVASSSSEAPVTPGAVAPLPANATSVPDTDLLKLSGMVQLGTAQYDRPDKARWTQALPIASRLLHGPCDCEQRNWLNHFVAMGKDALADANGQYYQDAKLMATLGRNDSDAMARRH